MSSIQLITKGEHLFEEIDYLRVPIGDPITTELVARLPYALRTNLQQQARSIWPDLSDDEIKHEIAKASRNFQEIENVRPLSAVIEWLLYQVQRNRYIKEAIEDTVIEVVNVFDNLKYVISLMTRTL